MKLSCAIIDDEPLAVNLLEAYTQKTPFLELKGAYHSAMQALPALNQKPVDLLFLDIQMPELSGMELSHMIISDRTRIIFTTAFEQYALDSYRVNALDYLLKPISYSDFLQSAQKALHWFELMQKQDSTPADKGPESIFVRSERRLIQIDLDKLLYVEGLKDYVKIYSEEQPHPILSLMSMKSMEEMLPSSRFIRVHRSYIVQPEKIKIIERGRIVFGKEQIPISDSYKEKFREFLAKRSLLPEEKK